MDFSKGTITYCPGSAKQKCVRSVIFKLCFGDLKFAGMGLRMFRAPGHSLFPIYTLGFHKRLYLN